MLASARRSQINRDRHIDSCRGLVQRRKRGARAAGLKASNRRLTRRHTSGKVALCQPHGFSRVSYLLPHLQSQTSHSKAAANSARSLALIVLNRLCRNSPNVGRAPSLLLRCMSLSKTPSHRPPRARPGTADDCHPRPVAQPPPPPSRTLSRKATRSIAQLPAQPPPTT